MFFFFFFQAEDGIRDFHVTGVQTCALPIYSPDGKKITYFCEKGDHHDQVYVANADATNAVNICNDTLNNIYPSWSLDGKKIIYAATHANDKTIVLSYEESPGNKKKIVKDAFYARYSPDGRKLAFIGGDWNDGVIYISTADGGNKKILIKKGDLLKL